MHVIVKDEFGGNTMYHRLLRLAVMTFAALLCVTSVAPCVAQTVDRDTYCVEVDVTNQITTVYRNSDRKIVRQMICSTGIENYTPLGTFNMEQSRPETDRQEWYFIVKYKCYVKYATRIKGSILFHSIPYSEKDMRTIDNEALAQLGTKASHGCIRLLWEDARWISEHCPEGTTVKIFNGAAKKTGLRDLLKVQGYTEDCRLTYRQFLDASPVENISGGLGRGSAGAEVSALQERLIGLGFLSETPTGVYDESTTLAVMRYQSAAGEQVNGVASRALLDRIMSEDDITAEYATLPPGCEGPLVAKLQLAMTSIGYYDGYIDGMYDDNLARALNDYCASNGIQTVQSVSPALRAEIYSMAMA